MAFGIKNPGVLLISFLAFVPFTLWLRMAPLGDRFLGYGATLTSIGQVSGLVGTVLFSLNLLLATRIKYLEKLFFGLNRAYISHHFLGGLAFILLLAHPIVLMIKYLPFGVVGAAQFLLPSSNDLAKTLGIFSLLLMMVLLVITFYLKVKYNIWKATHKFLGLAFFLAGLHVYFINSDVSRSFALRYYMLFIMAVGIFAIFYKTIFNAGKKWSYQVKNITELIANSVYEVELEPLALSMPYHAGQFIFVSFLSNKISQESHPFSLTASSKSKTLKFIVKNLGDYTSQIKNISIGTEAKISGPFGKFNYRNFSENQIWVAGGIGVTPFIGMARELSEKKNCKVCFIYSVSSQEEAICQEELSAMAKQEVLGQFHLFCSNKQGRISAKIINEICQGFSNKDILLCGPPPMIKALKTQLKEMGVPANKIHSEEFNLA